MINGSADLAATSSAGASSDLLPDHVDNINFLSKPESARIVWVTQEGRLKLRLPKTRLEHCLQRYGAFRMPTKFFIDQCCNNLGAQLATVVQYLHPGRWHFLDFDNFMNFLNRCELTSSSRTEKSCRPTDYDDDMFTGYLTIWQLLLRASGSL
jgi:hypothetical protein